MSQSDAGKGDKRCPCFVSDAELTLRWDYMLSKITLEKFYEEMKKLKGEK